MSPLRYQKWLRLNEVRRQMLNEHYDVTTAAYAVGYESAPLIVVMSPWISRTFLEAQKYPLAYIAQANKSSHFIFRVPPLTVADKCLLTQHLMQQKHREWVSL